MPYQITDQTTHSKVELDSGTIWAFPKYGTQTSVRNGLLTIQSRGCEILKILRSQISVPTSTSDEDLANKLSFMTASPSSGGTFLGALASNPASGSAGEYYYNTTLADYFFYNATYDLWLGKADSNISYVRSGNWGNNANFIYGEYTSRSDIGNFRGWKAPFDCIITNVVAMRTTTTTAVQFRLYNDRTWANDLANFSIETSIPSGTNEVEEDMLASASPTFTPLLVEKGDLLAVRGLTVDPPGSATITYTYQKIAT